MAVEPTVLDAWAVIAFLQGEEPAASRVSKALGSGRASMCWVNLGEVADGYAAAVAEWKNAILLTGDPELLDAAGAWRAEDLRAPSTP